MADPRKRLKLALGVVIITSLAAIVWTFLQSRTDRRALQQAIPKIASQAVMALSQVSQTATRDGAVQWKLDAASAELEADSGKMVLQSPEVHFFMEDGTMVHLTARSGVLNTNSNDIHVQGNVSLRNDRYTLTTETLFYTHESRMLRTDNPVEIVGGSMQLQATTMTYDLNTNQAMFSGRVKGIMHDKFAL